MNIELVDIENEAAGEMELADDVFGVEVREHLFWEVVKWQEARNRQGTAKAKRRSEVSGGGKKPWRQKGTGRARHGSIRSPLWVGGGKAHPPEPKDHSYQLSKSKRRAALKAALSTRAEHGNLRVVDSLELPEIKTKRAVEMLEALDATNALVVDVTEYDEDAGEVLHNEALRLSVRNLPDVKYIAAEGLNVRDILNHETLVLSQAAAAQIQEGLDQ